MAQISRFYLFLMWTYIKQMPAQVFQIMKAAMSTPYLFQFGIAEGWGQETPHILPSVITKTKDAIKHWLGYQVRFLS